MDNLPPEIICYIGDYLGAEKIALALTSKRLNQTLKADVKKIKKLIRAHKNYASFDFKLKNNINYVLLLRSTEITISSLPLNGKGCLIKHMPKLIKTKPGLAFIDEYGDIYEYNSKNIKRFLMIFLDLLTSSIYDSLICHKISSIIYNLINSYECRRKNFEKIVNIIRHYYNVLENKNN